MIDLPAHMAMPYDLAVALPDGVELLSAGWDTSEDVLKTRWRLPDGRELSSTGTWWTESGEVWGGRRQWECEIARVLKHVK